MKKLHVYPMNAIEKYLRINEIGIYFSIKRILNTI
jgi:hypothetical protein